METRQASQQSRLAGAIPAKDPDDLPLADVQVDIPQDARLAVPSGKIPDDKAHISLLKLS
jgi:hypothetical protein